MTLKELWVAYFQYPAIIAYIALSFVSAGVWYALSGERDGDARRGRPDGARLSPGLVHAAPLGAALQVDVQGAAFWPRPGSGSITTTTRIPNHLEVLFGALHTTLPTIAIVTHSDRLCDRRRRRRRGGVRDRPADDLPLRIRPLHPASRLQAANGPFVAEMKKRHMAHHFHDETGNFGITNYFWDRLFGTFYDRPRAPGEEPHRVQPRLHAGSRETLSVGGEAVGRRRDRPSAQARAARLNTPMPAELRRFGRSPSAADRRAFVDFAWDVYEDDPAWVPPLKSEVHGLLDPEEEPVVRPCQGAAVAGRARRAHRRPDQRAGRRAGARSTWAPGTGQWGMFEALDEAAAAALIATAEDWLRAQGMTRALGPISLSIWDEPGLRDRGVRAAADGDDGAPSARLSRLDRGGGLRQGARTC